MQPTALPLDALDDAAPSEASTVLILRPGCPVLARDAETLQIGLTPRLSVRLPDHPAVRELLDELRCGRVPGPLSTVAETALATLRDADLVLAVPGSATTDDGPARAQFGSDAVRRSAQRGAHRIGVRADRPSASLVVDLLADAGLTRDDDAATVWLLVAAGPVPRATVDPLQRAGVPHLLVGGQHGARRIGPFVDPGITACQRCVDAHEAVADPRLPFLLEQAATTGGRIEPVDPVLERLALSWAVRDLARYTEGEEPSTWSTTVDLGAGGAPLVTPRLRHPHCGCAWDSLLDLPSA